MLDRSGNPVLVPVGENTLASVEFKVVSGARTTWIGGVKVSNEPVGAADDFPTPVTVTGAGIETGLDVADVEYLSVWNNTSEASTLKVDVIIKVSQP